VVLNNGGKKTPRKRLIMENSGHLRCWPLAHALRSDQNQDISKKYDDLKARGTDIRMYEVRSDDIFDDEEARYEMEIMITGDENLDKHEDSLNSEYEFLGAENEINFEEKVCKEMKEMGVMDINPDELRGWMMMTSKKNQAWG
jgi:hypothetical protein